MKNRFLQQVELNKKFDNDKQISKLGDELFDIAIQNEMTEEEAITFVNTTIARLLTNCLNYIIEGTTKYSEEAIQEIEDLVKEV